MIFVEIQCVFDVIVISVQWFDKTRVRRKVCVDIKYVGPRNSHIKQNVFAVGFGCICTQDQSQIVIRARMRHALKERSVRVTDRVSHPSKQLLIEHVLVVILHGVRVVRDQPRGMTELRVPNLVHGLRVAIMNALARRDVADRFLLDHVRHFRVSKHDAVEIDQYRLFHHIFRFVVVMVHVTDVLIDLKEVSVCALKLEPIVRVVFIH